MSLIDASGAVTTLGEPAAIDAWNAAQTAFLAHGAATPARIADTLAAAPDFALCHAAMGFMQFLLGRRETVEVARKSLARARACVGDPREAAYVEALETALAGRIGRAAAMLDGVAARWPGDSLAVKLSHALRFLIGDAAGMRRAVEAAQGFGPDHPHAGYVDGCRAFALEETGAYADAERAGRRGLERAPDDAWGLHAVAHVFEMTGRPDDGVRWLAGSAARWAHCNNFGFHVWWHLALFHIDRGALGPALGLYDARVRAARTDDYRDIANAASLLARLALEGVDVGDRWEELAALAAPRVEHGGNVFADLHYVLALANAGRGAEARRLAARLSEEARGEGDVAAAASAAGVPAAEGVCAFAQGEWRAAWRRLTEAQAQLARVGGSHAQRDVFARLTVEAAIRGGMLDEAEAALSARPGLRPGVDPYVARRRAQIDALREARDRASA